MSCFSSCCACTAHIHPQTIFIPLSIPIFVHCKPSSASSCWTSQQEKWLEERLVDWSSHTLQESSKYPLSAGNWEGQSYFFRTFLFCVLGSILRAVVLGAVAYIFSQQLTLTYSAYHLKYWMWMKSFQVFWYYQAEYVHKDAIPKTSFHIQGGWNVNLWKSWDWFFQYESTFLYMLHFCIEKCWKCVNLSKILISIFHYHDTFSYILLMW
jgi:hypothetical protein